MEAEVVVERHKFWVPIEAFDVFKFFFIVDGVEGEDEDVEGFPGFKAGVLEDFSEVIARIFFFFFIGEVGEFEEFLEFIKNFIFEPLANIHVHYFFDAVNYWISLDGEVLKK